VVADEVRGLAKTVDSLSIAIRGQIERIARGLNDSHAMLRDIAAIDMSEENRNADARVRMVMRCLVEQNARFAEILQKTAAATEKVGNEVSTAIVAMQFQDLAAQRLENLKGALGALDESLREMNQGADAACGPADSELDHRWVEQMIARCTLKEMRTRFTEQLLGEHASASSTEMSAPPVNDDTGIELF
jgi:methyl-accepting chemotaxis protein